ncbi:MAG: pyrroline-5-carboxylate reductase [Candidatus Omnitrophica bacterium]|nr:pyrroline-5-carboxylate reductase [Candidatus Omnitrophota bacterium]
MKSTVAKTRQAPEKIRLGVIGCGNMGQAFLKALLSEKILSANQIVVSDLRTEVIDSLQRKWKFSVRDNRQLVLSSQVVVIAVKPPQVELVLKEVKDCFSEGKLILSVAAGITTRFIENCLAPAKIGVVRLMPNILVTVNQGVVAYTPGRFAHQADGLVKRLFQPLGMVIKIREDMMDGFTALSGSGPGYLFYLAEILEKIARKWGFPPKDCRTIVSSLLLGTGLMLKKEKKDAATLKEKVCSPGGTTLAGLAVLERRKLSLILQEAVKAAAERSKQLTR